MYHKSRKIKDCHPNEIVEVEIFLEKDENVGKEEIENYLLFTFNALEILEHNEKGYVIKRVKENIGIGF